MTSIGHHVFYGCTGLTSVNIPNSVTSIGNYVFSGCTGLTSVTIGNGVKLIGDDVFYGCTGLTSVNIPNSVTSIGEFVFDDCSGLKSVTIGHGVTSIGWGAFRGCTSLTSVHITDIAAWCKINFKYVKSGLDSRTYMNTFPGYYASHLYMNGKEIKDLIIPDGVTSLKNGAFYGFSGLTSVTIPNSVTSIEKYALSSCTELTDVYCYAEIVPSTYGFVFENSYIEYATLHVPEASVSAYKTTEPWSGFGSFEGIIPEGISINETNFPDENFRNWILSQNYGSDGVLTDEEIAVVTSMSVENLDIQSLKGIEFFTALTGLDCRINHLTSLDMSSNTALTELDCVGNQLTSLDVSNNTALTRLNCGYNQLTSLDVSSNTALTYLNCYYNHLTSLVVSNNTALTKLDCGLNQLTSLDVSINTALTYLNCYYNHLTSLDVSNNTALTELDCGKNQLTSLDVSINTALTYLFCGGNQLTSLDVSSNTALTYLNCYENHLTSLDVSNNTALTYLSCYFNQINDAGMDALVASLPTVSNGEMYVIGRNEGNVMTTKQVAAVKVKGWIPYYYYESDWQEYAGSVSEVEKCATPTISFVGGKIVFDCETEGVEFVSEVTCSDSGKYSGSEIPFTSTYTVSVYAKKEGYEDSDVATKEITVGGSTGIRADVNEDGTVNGTDIQEVINFIVNAE